MKIKFTLLLILAVIFSADIFADVITSKTAELVARNFYYEKTSIKQAQITFESTQTEYEGGVATYYIFNISNGEGFIIVSANDIYTPIIGYSIDKNYVSENQPENIKSWMQSYEDKIIFGVKNDIKQADDFKAEWSKYNVTASEFVPEKSEKGAASLTNYIKWDQGAGWNDLCPEDEAGPGGHVYAGCVATAMAIVMKYWDYPIKGTGSSSYNCYPYGNLTANFGTTRYFPSYMDTVQANQYSALLIYHCGVAVDMSYSPEGSGSYVESNALYAMKYYFGFKTTANYKSKSAYSPSNWIALLKTQIDDYKPILYRGYDPTPVTGGGHAFVCDGYDDDDKFWFNFGWSGSNNGYYALDDVYGFYDSQGCIIDLEPNIVLPESPQNLTVTHDLNTLDNFKVDLEWDVPANATGLTGYKVYRGDELLSTISNTSTTSYSDDELIYGIEDYYGVIAMYSSTESRDVSGYVSAKYTITFKVKNGENNSNISGALVTFNNSTKSTVYGSASFSSVFFGPDYEYTVTHPDFPTKNGVIDNIYQNETITVLLGDNTSIENLDNIISIYPNPSKGIFTVNCDSEIINIDVYNVSGQLIKQIKNSNTFDLSEFSNGLYFIKILIGNETIFQKITKN